MDVPFLQYENGAYLKTKLVISIIRSLVDKNSIFRNIIPSMGPLIRWQSTARRKQQKTDKPNKKKQVLSVPISMKQRKKFLKSFLVNKTVFRGSFHLLF